MARLVDHHARRCALADQAGVLIAGGGMDALSFRKLAAISGCSTSVVTHYFHDKSELLWWSFVRAAERADALYYARHKETGGNVLACLLELLPLTDERMNDWKVYLAFFQQAAVHYESGALQRWWVRHTRHNFANDLFATGKYDRREASRKSREVITLIMGVSLQAILDRHSWSPNNQRVYATERLRAMGFDV